MPKPIQITGRMMCVLVVISPATMLEKAMTTVNGMSWTPEEMTEEPRT
jgi:hypothetical protein